MAVNKTRVFEFSRPECQAFVNKGFAVDGAPSLKAARADAIVQFFSRFGAEVTDMQLAEALLENAGIAVTELDPASRQFDEYVSSLIARRASDQAAADVKAQAEAARIQAETEATDSEEETDL